MKASLTDCRRFYAISKKIPKDVKRYCGTCRQHNLVVETRGHNCKFKNCECSRCLLVKQRRRIMRTQIRLRRAQDKCFQRTLEPTNATIIPQNQPQRSDNFTRPNGEVLIDVRNSCYFCQKCKNHGVLMWKKDHKRFCKYSNCGCDQCVLIETRRTLDQYLKKSRHKKCSGTLKGVIEYASPTATSSAESPNFFCQKLMNNCNIRTLEQYERWKSGFIFPQSHSTVHSSTSTDSLPLFGMSDKILATYPTVPSDLNSLVMLQLTNSGAIFPSSQTAYTNSASIFQQSANAYNNLQQINTKFAEPFTKDVSVYASLLNCAQNFSFTNNSINKVS